MNNRVMTNNNNNYQNQTHGPILLIPGCAGHASHDGLFKQVSHREYFLDSIGKLRIAIW